MRDGIILKSSRNLAMTGISDKQGHQGYPGLEPQLNFSLLRAAPELDGEGKGDALKWAVVPGLVVPGASACLGKKQPASWSSCSTSTDPGGSNASCNPKSLPSWGTPRCCLCLDPVRLSAIR